MSEPVRILVVDDSATIRTALQLILAPTGYGIDFACTGADAVDRAALEPPTVIMLDFILPDMRGTEVCRALLADPRTRNVPVVLVSARGAEIRQAYQDVENVVAYLTKPFTPEQVHACIEDVLALTADGRTAPAADAMGDAPPAALPADASAAPLDPPPPAEAVTETAPAPAWSDVEIEDTGDDEVELEPAPAAPVATRDALDAMFETLRAGLEGVHVEESDTPAGAAADRSRSYAELAAHLSRQLGETLAHATSGARHTLYSDGSIRSLDDALLDAYRRVCRLVFRSAGARPANAGPRVLFVGVADGDAATALDAAGAGGDWRLFRITSGFCQLPLMARAYGPSHVVVDLAGPTLWSELASLRRMPESRRLRVIGVIAAGAQPPDDAQLARHGIGTVLTAGPHLADALRACIDGEPEAVGTPVVELEASAA